jgi:hypothetical protein
MVPETHPGKNGSNEQPKAPQLQSTVATGAAGPSLTHSSVFEGFSGRQTDTPLNLGDIPSI